MKKENLEKMQKYKALYETAKAAYQQELNKINQQEKAYNGTREIRKKGGGISNQEADCCYNITYRLIESEIDTTIPTVRVDPIHEEDEKAAESIQAVIRTEFERCGMAKLNDSAERMSAVFGGVPFLVEWNNDGGYHDTVGEATVKILHPKNVIPQPGVTEIEQCEYIFVRTAETKQSIHDKYGVPLSDLSEDEPEARKEASADKTYSDELATKIDCYFKHMVDGELKVGVCSWANRAFLRYDADYYARKITVCEKCGKIKTGEVCQCGSKKFVTKPVQTEMLDDMQMTVLGGGTDMVPSVTDGDPVYAQNPDGSLQYPLDENGEYDTNQQPIQIGVEQVRTVLPQFSPKRYPIVMRRNISKFGSFLGRSDVDVIADQQNSINKVLSKMQEKLMKGGSFVTLPQGVSVDTSNKELKVIRVKPHEVSMIDVLNIQPSIDKDMNFLSVLQSQAQDALGLTNAFLGQQDTTAVSGSAKQFSANQSAARLSSRRSMKYAFMEELANLIIQTYMAFSGGAIPYSYESTNGEKIYSHFDPKELIKLDAAGEMYWNTEFIFRVDESATVASNHENMWNMMSVMYQAGAYGAIGQDDTNLLYWELLKEAKYPGAGKAIESIKAKIQKQMAMMQQSMPTITNETIRNNGIDDRTTVQKEDLTNLAAMGVSL